MDDSKGARQAAFWQSMMNKYQERNFQLEEQQCHLQHRLEAMQVSMPAALMYNMNKTTYGNQIDMTKFVTQLGKPQVTVTTTSSIISGCPCTPCMAKRNSFPSTKSQQPPADSGSSIGSCSCNPCMDGSNSQPSTSSDGSCSCNPSGSSPQTSDVGSTSSCPCSACMGASKPSIGTDGNSSTCPCNPCMDSNVGVPTRTPPPNLCTCDPCLANNGMPESNMLEKLSIFSLQSADIQCMNKLQELATREKQMKHQLQEMEHREQAYLETLRQADEMWATVEGSYKQRLSDVKQSGDNTCLKYQKMSEQLMDENARLTDELKDLKLELKQCLERVQGPITRQLDKERRKSEKLEQDLLCSSKVLASKEGSYMKQMGNLQNQLNCTCRNLCELNSTNDQLKREMCMIQCKYNQLQQDLINQKLSEAHTLQRLQECLEMKAMGGQKDGATEEPEDASLYAIGRRLSQALLDVDGCDECRTLPDNLKDTVKGIKSIVDIVDRAGKPKDKGKGPDDEEPKPPPPEGPGPGPGPGEESEESEESDHEGATVIDSTLEISVEAGSAGEGSVEISTETEVIAETPSSRTSSRTPSEKLSREPSGTISEEPSGKLSGEPSGKLSREPSEKISREPSGKISREPSGKLSREPSEKLSKVSSKQSSERSSKAPSREGLSREPSKTKSSRVSIQEPTEVTSAPLDTVALKESEVMQEEVEITTEVETAGDVEVDVETEVNLYDTVSDGINVTTTITSSGTLEVVTEGPAGIIETTMTYTESGNIEVTTEITEYPAEGYGQAVDEGYGQAVDEGYGQALDEGYGQAVDEGYGQAVDEGYGQAVDEGYGQAADGGYGQAVDEGYGQAVDEGYGQAADEGYGQAVGEGYGQAVDEGYKQTTEERYGEAIKEGSRKSDIEVSVSSVSRITTSASRLSPSASSRVTTESSFISENLSKGERREEESEAEEWEAEEARSAAIESKAKTTERETAGGKEAVEIGMEISAEVEEGEGIAAADVDIAIEIRISGEAGEAGAEGEVGEAGAGEGEIGERIAAAEISGEVGEFAEVEAGAEGTTAEGGVAEATGETELGGEAGIEVEATVEVEAIAEEETGAEVFSEAEVVGKESELGEEAFAEAKSFIEAEAPSEREAAKEIEAFVEAEAPSQAEIAESEVFAEAKSEVPSAVESEVYVEAEAAVPAQLEIKVEVTEGGAEIVEMRAAIDIEEETEEEKAKRLRHESIDEQPYSVEDNADDLRKGVEEALNKANKDVMDALDQANKNVTEALAKANKDVESALTLAVKESQSKANKQVGTEQDVLKHPSILESVPKGAEDKMVPLVVSATREPTATEAEMKAGLVPEESAVPAESAAAAPDVSAKAEEPTGATVAAPPSDATPKEGWDALFGDKKPDMPQIGGAEKCKDVCSPTYTQEQAEICKDVCATAFKEQAARKSVSIAPELAVKIESVAPESAVETPSAPSPPSEEAPAPSAEVTIPATPSKVSSKSAIESAAEIIIEQETVVDAGSVRIEQEISIEISEVSEAPTTTLERQITIQESKEIEEEPSKTGSRAPSIKAAGAKETPVESKSEYQEGVKVSSRTGSKVGVQEEARPSSRKLSKAEVQEGARPPSRKSSKTEDQEGVKSLSRKSSKAGDQEGAKSLSRKSSKAGDQEGVKSLSRKSSKAGDQEGAKSLSRKSSKAEDQESATPSSRRSSKAGDQESARPSSRRSSKAEDQESARSSSRKSSKAEDQEGARPPSRKPSTPDERESKGSRRSSERPDRISSVPDACSPPRSPRLSRADRRSSEQTRPSVSTPRESISRIPVPIPRHSKLADIKCDCGECDCEICSPEIIKQKDEKLKAARLARGLPDDCTCTPGCTCVRCSSAGDSPIKGRSKAQVESTRASMECCDPRAEHPPDCDCLECLCEPCGTFLTEEETKKHPADCDCIKCLCEPCAQDEEPCRDKKSAPSSKEQSLKEIFREKSLAESLKSCREESCRKLIESREQSQRKLAALAEHPPNCDCVICRCCYCPEKKAKEESTARVHSFPPEECTCVECLCLRGIPPTVQQVPTPYAQTVIVEQISTTGESSKLEQIDEVPVTEDGECAHPPDCDCLECLLICDLTCPDTSARPKPTQAAGQQENILEMDDDNMEICIEEMENESAQRKQEMDELRGVIKQIQCACYEAEVRAVQSSPAEQMFVAKQRSSFEATMSGLQVALSSLQDKCKQKDRMIAAMIKELKLRANSKVFDDMLQKLATDGGSEIAVDFDRTEVCDSLPRPICDPKYGKRSNQLKEPPTCEPCGHPDYPNCPCLFAAGPSKPPPTGKPEKSPICDHPNYPDCPCAAAGPSKPPPTVKPKPEKSPVCNHPNFPDCPCAAKPEQISDLVVEFDIPPAEVTPKLPEESLAYGHADYANCPCETEQIVKPLPEVTQSAASTPKEELIAVTSATITAEDATSQSEEPLSQILTVEITYSESDKPPAEKEEEEVEHKLPSEKTSLQLPRSTSSTREPLPCSTGSRTCAHPNYPHCPCTATNKPPTPVTPQPSKHAKKCTCPKPKATPAPPQNLLPCPQPDGTCPCPKRPNTTEGQKSLPAAIKIKKHSASCPCSRAGSPKKVAILNDESGEEQKTTTDEDSTTTDQKTSSSSDRRSKRSTSSSRRSSSTSDRKSSSTSRSDRKDSSGSDRHGASGSERRCPSKRKKSPHHKRSCSAKRKSLDRKGSSKSPPKPPSATPSRDSKRSPASTSPKESKYPGVIEEPPEQPSTSQVPISHSARLRKLSNTPPMPCPCGSDKPPLGEVIDSSPMEVTEIRRISPDSLLIKWSQPASKYVTGYEILVDGIIKSRVHSERRTQAVLHTLTIKSSVQISIYAITKVSRCQPPANAIFQV